MHPELAEDVAEVVADSFLRELEFGCHLGGGEARCEELEDLLLALGQVWERLDCGQVGENRVKAPPPNDR